MPYTRDFSTWETFKIIKQEMLLSTGLCLLAVLIITMALIAHPLTSLLVFVCVLMTIVDILGCTCDVPGHWAQSIAELGHSFFVRLQKRTELLLLF